MGKNEKTPIIINDVEYSYEDMTNEQQVIINHVADLDRKLSSAKFNVDQLEVGKSAFVKMLTDSLSVENIQAVTTQVHS
jgi:hypothetical protein|tara:strand:+ start:557 stop:793 length:237 start_codon:yes stop_codon:yes gene_type:complete